MAGFDNQVMFANNVDFRGVNPVVGQVIANGQLLIGSVTGAPIQANTLSSADGSVTITNGPGSIDLKVDGGTTVVTSLVPQIGTSPVSPVGGVINLNGAVVAAGTNPVRTDGTGTNNLAIQLQTSQAIASTNAANIGLSAFNSEAFSVDGNGFVSLIGGGIPTTDFDVDAHTSPVTNPVVPSSSGIVTITGGQVAAGTTSNVIRTNSLAANTYAGQVQRSQAVASSTVGANGVSHFNSAQFTVDSNGFVSATGTLPIQFTGDSGTPAVPSGGNINILGGPGVTTSTAGSTVTINSVVFTDQGSSTTVESDNGYFVTGTFNMTLPASPVQGEMVIIYADTTNTVTITANTGQVIRQGTNVTASAGSITSGAQGDSLTLRYRSTGAEWNAVGSTGGWIF